MCTRPADPSRKMKLLLSRLLDELAAAIAKRLPSPAVAPVPPPTPPTSTPAATIVRETAPAGSFTRKRNESAVEWFVDALEWELLAEPIEAEVNRVGQDAGDFGVLSVSRDDDYRIVVSLDAVGAASWADPHFRGVPGSFNDGLEIVAETQRRRELRLPRAYLSKTSRQWNRGQTTTRIGILANSVVRVDHTELKPALLVDWYISGPKDHLATMFRRVTERVRSSSYRRTRQGFARDTVEQRFASGAPPAGNTEGFGADYIVLLLACGPVRVCLVPQGNAPAWTHPIGIEFPVREAEPPQDLREGVVEALGFVFGRHILKVGTTIFDEAGVALREEANSPWGRDVTDMAGSPDAPVTRLEDWDRAAIAETLLNQLVPAYLAARAELNLKQVVWTMWVALRMPLTMDTPLYASALEALMRGWFESQRSKTKGTYMPTKEFRRIYADGIAKFEAAAKGVEYGDRIARKIGRANEMGVNERFDVFFEELGLPVDEGEGAVIRSRNVSAHGGKTGGDHHDLLYRGAGYRTLLNRVLLKVLGFKGSYIDYSVLGHPSRGIDEPIGYRSPANP